MRVADVPYVISKSSRTPTAVSYNGPACLVAGVAGGRIYEDKAEAEADAMRLTEANPVGFLVSELPAQAIHDVAAGNVTLPRLSADKPSHRQAAHASGPVPSKTPDRVRMVGTDAIGVTLGAEEHVLTLDEWRVISHQVMDLIRDQNATDDPEFR